MSKSLKFWKNVGLNQIFKAPAEEQLGTIELQEVPREQQVQIHPALKGTTDERQIENAALGEPFLVMEADGSVGIMIAVPASRLRDRAKDPKYAEPCGISDEKLPPEVVEKIAKADEEYYNRLIGEQRGVYLREGDPRLPIRQP